MTITVTDNFGFVAVREAVPSTSDWACTYWNWIVADAILYGLIAHTHDGVAALQNPTGTLSLSTATTGGYLPANTTYYIAITYVDALGRETAASSVANKTTGAGITKPDAPTIDDAATPTDIQPAVGGLSGGNYWYKIAYTLGGGESLPSLPVYVQIPTDTTYECTIHFPSIDTVGNGADGIYVYRKIGSTGNYVLLADLTNTALNSYTDDNTGVPTCDKSPLASSTIASFHTITIDWSALDYTEAEKVRVYATTTSGTYPTNALITEVDMNDATPVEDYTWTGIARTAGKPPEVSECFANPSKIALATQVSGNLPWVNLPSDFLWNAPVDTYASLPTGEAGEARVVEDEAAVYVWDGTLATPTWTKLGGILMYSYADNDNIPNIYSSEADYKTWIYMSDDNYMMFQGRISTSGELFSIPLFTSGVGGLGDRIGYFGYSEDTPGGGYAPWYGYGAVTFYWNTKEFWYYDDEIATPAWVRGPGVVKLDDTIDDVAEDATPTNEQLKINEILQALRDSGLIAT